MGGDSSPLRVEAGGAFRGPFGSADGASQAQREKPGMATCQGSGLWYLVWC